MLAQGILGTELHYDKIGHSEDTENSLMDRTLARLQRGVTLPHSALLPIAPSSRIIIQFTQIFLTIMTSILR